MALAGTGPDKVGDRLSMLLAKQQDATRGFASLLADHENATQEERQPALPVRLGRARPGGGP